MSNKRDYFYQAKLAVSTSDAEKGPHFGKDVAGLLHGIKETGSLNKATKDAQMAYSKGWLLIKEVENDFGFDLIDRHGARGSVLTDEAELLLARYDEFESKVQEYASKTFAEIFA